MNPYARSLIAVLREGTCEECTPLGGIRTRELREHEVYSIAVEIVGVLSPGSRPLMKYDAAAQEVNVTTAKIAQWVVAHKVSGHHKKKLVSLNSLVAYMVTQGHGRMASA